MSDHNVHVSGGISGITALGIVFVTLKLLDKIDWSWAWVTCPFWIGPVIIVAVVGLVSLTMGIAALVAFLIDQVRSRRGS